MIDVIVDLVVVACGAIFIAKNKDVVKDIADKSKAKVEEFRDSIEAKKNAIENQA